MTTLTTPSSFTLSVPDTELSDLRSRLALTRFPAELAGAGDSRGPQRTDIERLVARWQDGYDWRRREADINQLPMYMMPIGVEGFGELAVHFLHKRSVVPGAIPLLFVHGWPGHFLEVEKLLPLLLDSADGPSFHVVAPSLPGFGFSDFVYKTGFALDQYAELCDGLMRALGYKHYVTQGGDWGNHITRLMAVRFGGSSLRAAHSNYPQAWPISPLRNPLAYLQDWLASLSSVEHARAERTTWFKGEGHGYNTQQGTRPQTLGYALTDSPAGLLAWIYEKLIEWTDGYPWTDDEVLDWVSIYWFSRAGSAASLHIYYERVHAPALRWEDYVSVPYGISLFPRELQQPPLARIHAAHNVVFVGEHARGGHFAAHEQPAALAGDLRAMFGRNGPAYGVVPGHDGY